MSHVKTQDHPSPSVGVSSGATIGVKNGVTWVQYKNVLLIVLLPTINTL